MVTTTAQRSIARVWQTEIAGRLVGLNHLMSVVPLGPSGRAVVAGLIIIGMLAIAERQRASDGFAVFQHLVPAAISLVALSLLVALLAPVAQAADRRPAGANNHPRSTRLAWLALGGLALGLGAGSGQWLGGAWLLAGPLVCLGLLAVIGLRLGTSLQVGLVTLAVLQLAAGLFVTLVLPRGGPSWPQQMLIAGIAAGLSLVAIAIAGRPARTDRIGLRQRSGRSILAGPIAWLREDALALGAGVLQIRPHALWLGLAAVAGALSWLVVGGQTGVLNRLLLPLTGIVMTRLIVEEVILRGQLLDPLARRIGPAAAIVILALVSAAFGWLARGGAGLLTAAGSPWAGAAAALAAAITAGILWRRCRSPLLVVVFRLVVP